MAELPNAYQVYLYLTGRHSELTPETVYKVGKNTVGNHIKAGKLSPARSGGFPKRTVDSYARSHLTPKKGPASVKNETLDMGAQEKRVNADAELKIIEARRKKMLFEREAGKLISILCLEQELAARWQAVSLLLGNFSHEVSDEVAVLFGGGQKQALEIIGVCCGDPEKAEEVSRLAFAKKSEFVSFFRKRCRAVLSSLVSGKWFTEEMESAWEKWEQSRVKASREEALDAIITVGGDPEKVDLLLELFEVSARKGACIND